MQFAPPTSCGFRWTGGGDGISVMAIQSNACGGTVFGGSECRCGCRYAAARPAASCQCAVCNRGQGCNCEGDQDASARQSESR